MKHGLKLFCLVFVTIVCFFFVNSSHVLAVNNADGKGYARCYYDWVTDGNGRKYSSSTYTYTNSIYSRPYRAVITAYKAKAGYYVGWAVVGAGEYHSDTDSFDKNSTKYICTVDNYDDIFSNMDSIVPNKFRSGNTWKCPDSIYLEMDGNADSMKMFFDSSLNRREAKLSKNISKQSGKPGKADASGGKTDRKDVTSDGSTAKLTGESTSKKLSDDDIKKIKNWGKKGNEEKDRDYNGFSITNDLQKFIDNLVWILSIIGILLLLVMTAIEFIKVITGSDENGLGVAFKHTLIRIFCVILLLLLPSIVGSITGIISKNSGITSDIKDSNDKYISGSSGKGSSSSSSSNKKSSSSSKKKNSNTKGEEIARAAVSLAVTKKNESHLQIKCQDGSWSKNPISGCRQLSKHRKVSCSSCGVYNSAYERYYNDGHYASCDSAVATAIRTAGLDSSFPGFYVTKQAAHLKKSSKWKHIGEYCNKSKCKVKTSDLKPGDVLYKVKSDGYPTNHIKIYVGSKYVKERFSKADSSIKWFEAGNRRFYPSLYKRRASSQVYHVYRRV